MRNFCLLVCAMILACGEAGIPADRAVEPSPSEVATLGSTRIFFGHQSVGRNVLSGIAEVAPSLRVIRADDPAALEEGGLVEASIGRNGDPASKDRAFLEATARLGPGDVALYKYCYVDMSPDSDPDSLAARYERTLAEVATRGVRTVAVTMPLTTVAPAWKRWLKQALGRPTDRELNALRQRFNDHLRRGGDRPLVDLARLEATGPDGKVRSVTVEGQTVEVLVEAYTDDGSHLNARGRRHVASHFLRALAHALSADSGRPLSSR